MTGAGYVVEIKESARRRWGPAGEWVNREGPTRTFASKADAREWAAEAGNDARVWVQDAVPHDRSDVDGYLVGTRDRSGRAGAGSAGEQSELEGFDGVDG